MDRFHLSYIETHHNIQCDYQEDFIKLFILYVIYTIINYYFNYF